MFILLVIACIIYLVLGKIAEGITMSVAITIVTSISLFQETRSAKALRSLNQYLEPKVKVIRDGNEKYIQSSELVPGDVMILEEGMRIPADASLVSANDLSTNDSIITGESVPVEKNPGDPSSNLYQGSTINSGKCMAIVTATGNETKLGKIGISISEYTSSKTLLQLQLNRFVNRFALFGFAGFIIILLVNYIHYQQFTMSLLFALTVAMSVIPEEIPVAFSSFMALGAFKMGKAGVISRQPQIIENLGAMNLLCFDKTGTLTENKMQVKTIYEFETGSLTDAEQFTLQPEGSLLWYANLASEAEPFDAMEKAIAEVYQKHKSATDERPLMVHEYPLEGRPPMMTHVFRLAEKQIVAAKGAVERIVKVCKLNNEEIVKITDQTRQLSSHGYRILAVAKADLSLHEFPKSQNEFDWKFLGLVALYDPPRENAAGVIKQIYDAGIGIKLITGDYPETAVNIAQQVGIQNALTYYTGEEVMNMNEDQLKQASSQKNIFARMFPEAKLKLVNNLKASGNIVAMTGDGVNDGPALKAAHIGIAMGKKGTATATGAADLILADDNLENIAVAVSEGRRIYSNLIKAIRYIISIHIPIILTASIPLILGWRYPNIFSPVHVIFLELIMAPTCSIFYEREPVEKWMLQSGPRSRSVGLFRSNELIITIIQGIVVAAGVLGLYYYFMSKDYPIEETRMVVFTTLLISNVFLTFSNRSFTKSIFTTIRYKNNLALYVFGANLVFLVLLHFIPAIRDLFELASLNGTAFFLCFAVGFFSVMWIEVYKLLFGTTTISYL